MNKGEIRFKSRRKQIIAKMFTKNESRTIYVKDGKLLLDIEKHEERKGTLEHFLDNLIDRFNCCIKSIFLYPTLFRK